MRSLVEIAFRIRQEAANLRMYVSGAPTPALEPAPLRHLPDPGPVAHQLRDTLFAREVERLARSILQHRIPVMDRLQDTGPEIRWRRDYLNGVESPPIYFRRIPYLDFSAVGEHRQIWELNRHQHLVLLAQAHLFRGSEDYLAELYSQLESWLAENPFLQGINWTSALEVAFRALSWIWIYHLAGARMPDDLRARFLTCLYRHGLYLQHNLSIYFSPNTHLQGEAVALHALGTLFPSFARAALWRRLGATILSEQIDAQVHDDGSHFEQSSYYHVYALDFFLWHAILTEPSTRYRDRLHRMADYLSALMGPARVLPLLGDDDGGRVFHPYGSRERFGRSTLATCGIYLQCADWGWELADVHDQAAWWLGERALRASPATPAPQAESRLFAQAGVAVLNAGSTHITMDAGPFGAASAGHSHSDTLSLLVRYGDEEILIDPGTYTYSDELWRGRFRGSAAHNTVRIDKKDQAVPVNAFRWGDKPEVRLLAWSPDPGYIDATCRYAGFTHRRRILLVHPELLLVLDDLDGPPGGWLLEQFWHPGLTPAPAAARCVLIGSRTRLVFAAPDEIEISEAGEYGWRSHVFGWKEPSPLIRVWRNTPLPAQFAAAIDFSGYAEHPTLQRVARDLITYSVAGRDISISLPDCGPPVIASDSEPRA